jgi:hypothetical protein
MVATTRALGGRKEKKFFFFFFFGNKGQWCKGEHYGGQGGKGNYFVFPK